MLQECFRLILQFIVEATEDFAVRKGYGQALKLVGVPAFPEASGSRIPVPNFTADWIIHEDVDDSPFGIFPAFLNDPDEAIVRRQNFYGYRNRVCRIGIFLLAQNAAHVRRGLPGVIDRQGQLGPGFKAAFL